MDEKNTPQLVIGIQVCKGTKGLEKNIRDAVKSLNINCCQIFTHGPRTLYRNNIDCDSVYELIQDLSISLIVHGSYLLVGLWNHNKDYKFYQSRIQEELDDADDMSADGLVLHINDRPPQLIAKAINESLSDKKYNTTLMLEMVAMKSGDNSYETYEKMDNLSKLIDSNINHNWCVDTAHLWAAGIDLRNYEDTKLWLSDFENSNLIGSFHLNGSSKKLGGGADAHSIPFCSTDNIWGEMKLEDSGFRAIIEFAYKRGIPIICEHKKGTRTDLQYFIKMAKKTVTDLKTTANLE